MSEKIAFASWNYIRLICANHREEITLDVINGRPFYRCNTEGCTTKISAALYEKILDDVIAFQNKEVFPVGHRWKRKSESRVIELAVTACTNGMRPEISVRVL